MCKTSACCSGAHSDVKPVKPPPKDNSNTHTPTQKSTPTHTAAPVKSIEEFNKETGFNTVTNKQEKPKLELKPIITSTGKYKCSNVGCNTEFNPEDNSDTACNYHPSKPVFRDIEKRWPCCNKSAWEWDDFQKIKPCNTGKHQPKMA
eukprot:GHVR01012444.1.p1 GENE.GHVR01012444.1~~GHVR01012444.1.p1  ORF type:complete len:147 (+),score=37.13 GHVR01012444.1:43-483(+)